MSSTGDLYVPQTLITVVMPPMPVAMRISVMVVIVVETAIVRVSFMISIIVWSLAIPVILDMSTPVPVLVIV